MIDTAALTHAQEQAVARREEPLMLSAGAGSGKTLVLVERFVRAVREDGVAPGRILAITFTERAAGELRERVRERFLALGDREAARDTEAAVIGTFHSFCAGLLRAHPLAAGLDPEFSILEEGFARRLRGRAFNLALGEFLRGERVEAVDLIAAYGADRVRSIVEGVYAELRSRGQEHPRLPPAAAAPSPPAGRGAQGDAGEDELAGARACALLDELLDGFGRSYRELKRARGAVDFDDLELHARELLRARADVRGAFSERFELLMVDEFQDTNPRQLAILSALERGNLFTVGDELQSIYGFRDADVGLFRARSAELARDGRSLALVENFRSLPALLDVVNAVFARRFEPRYAALQATREAPGESAGKASAQPRVELLLTSRRGWNGQPGAPGAEAAACASARVPGWREAEARLLADRVAELVRGGEARAGEIAVLLRAMGDLEVYERALRARGLRTLAAVGGFWGRQEVGDLLSYLRALANPLDELSLYATLASPLVGLSSDALALLGRAARERGGGQVWATIEDAQEELDARLPSADREALAAFRERFARERRAASRRTISQLIERAIQASRYRDHVLGLEWGERRLANVHKLLRLARRFEAGEGRDLRAFLDQVAHEVREGSAPEPDAPVAGVEPDAVRLLSIHAAKGLEFPVVCIADLGRAQNLSVPDLLVDGERIGLRLARLGRPEPVASLQFDDLSQARKQAQAEEEDRILYVAMTRARDRLLLSGAVDFERWPEPRLGAPPIAWLGPALAPELPALAQARERGRGEPEHSLSVGAGGASVRCRFHLPADASVPAPDRDAGRRQNAQLQLALAPAGGPPARTPAVSPGGADGDAVAGGSPLAQAGALSYTSLSELERCGYRYYLERILGMEENHARAGGGRPREGVRARARGALVHRLLESVDFARPVAPSDEQVRRIARELGLRLAGPERREVAALVATVTERGARAGTASGGSLGARVAAARRVRRECPFAFSLGPRDPLVSGVIDLLAQEPDGGALVLDYKTDRVDPDADLELLVERDYGAQRLLYALAVLRDGAPAVEVVHWFLQRGEWAGARYSADALRELEARLDARLKRAQAGGFVVSDRPHRALCETCPGRGSLCSWSEAETSRQTPCERPAAALAQ